MHQSPLVADPAVLRSTSAPDDQIAVADGHQLSSSEETIRQLTLFGQFDDEVS